MTHPTLTVITPNYNHGKHLPRALTALVERERPPDEVILIDDGSTDDSWQIIQDFSLRYPCIRAYRNEKNMGVEFTLERGLSMAQGDYIYGAAADDFVQPGFIEKAMGLLERYPQAGLCCTIGEWQELETGLRWHMGVGMTDEPAYLSPQRMVELERAGRLYIPGHTVIYKKSALFEVGKFQSEAKYGCDWLAYSLVGFHYGICVVPESLAVCEIRPNTYFQRGRRDRRGALKVMEAIMQLLCQAAFQDAVEHMRLSGALYVWGHPMLKVLLKHRDYRRFLTPVFLAKNLWYTVKLVIKRFMPRILANVYFKLAGYHAKGPKMI